MRPVMSMVHVISVGLAAAGVLVGTSVAAGAYCASPALAWPTSTLTIAGASSIPMKWNDALSKAANQWNGYRDANWTVNWYGVGYPGQVQAKVHKQSTAPDGFDNGPAVTAIKPSGSAIISGDIYFNDAFTWNLSGGMSKSEKYADVRTVAIHELGHEIYLNHPGACGSMTDNEVLAAMNPNWFQKWYTRGDDIDGLQARK